MNKTLKVSSIFLKKYFRSRRRRKFIIKTRNLIKNISLFYLSKRFQKNAIKSSKYPRNSFSEHTKIISLCLTTEEKKLWFQGIDFIQKEFFSFCYRKSLTAIFMNN